MVDELFYPHDSGAWLGPMMSVASAVESSYSGAATLGTANLGNVASLKTQKFVLLDDDSTSMTHGAPRYYEIGPKQIPPYDAAADGGPASYPYPMAAAVRRCKPGAAGLGCTAAMVFGSSWNANDASATKLAVCETWPSSTGCP